MAHQEQEPAPINKIEELLARTQFTTPPETYDAVTRIVDGTLALSEETLPDKELREELAYVLIAECTSLEALEIRLVQTQFVFEEHKVAQAFEMLPALKEADESGMVTESFLRWFTEDYGLRDKIRALLL